MLQEYVVTTLERKLMNEFAQYLEKVLQNDINYVSFNDHFSITLIH